MPIVKSGYHAECDSCGDEMNYSHATVELAMREARRSGWTVNYIKGKGRIVKCSECQERDRIDAQAAKAKKLGIKVVG